MAQNKKTVDLLHKELSYEIQGAVFEVRKDFGLGHKEQIYQKAFEEELKRRQISYEREAAIKIYSPKDGKYIGLYRPDFIVDKKIIVELKTQAFLPKAEIRKIYDYLRNSEYELGYLINYGSEQLYVKRVIYTEKNKPRAKAILASISFLLALISGLFGGPERANAATLYAGSANQVVYENQSFVVDWFLDTQGISLNTVDLKLKFTNDTLRVVSADTGNSLLSLWIKQPTVNSDEGLVELTGGAPNGFIGSKIPIFRITFEPVKTGNGRVEMLAESKVLRNDGMGTSEKLFFPVLEFPIISSDAQPVKITSKTHPDQNLWYRDRKVVVSFESEPGNEYSYSISSNLEVFPDATADPVQAELAYDNLPDGIYYFRLNVRSPNSAWEEAAVYRIKIDATAPVSFTPEKGTEAGQDFISFSTVDKTSGILHYKVKVGLFGKAKIAESPYKLHRPLIGDSVVVEAFDSAGNKQTASVDYPGLVTGGQLKILLVLIGCLFIAWAVYKKFKQKPTSKIENI